MALGILYAPLQFLYSKCSFQVPFLTTQKKKNSEKTQKQVAKSVKLPQLVPDLILKVLDKLPLKDLQQLRCTSKGICELIERHAKGLKSVRNLELVRLRDGECWWYSEGVGGPEDFQRRGHRSWSQGLQHLYGIKATAIRIESKVTDELMLSLQKSRLSCVTLVLRGNHKPTTIQELLSVLRPSALFFEGDKDVDLTGVNLHLPKKMNLLDVASVRGLDVLRMSQSIPDISTVSSITDEDANTIILEWLRFERQIVQMKFEDCKGEGGGTFYQKVMMRGIQKKTVLIDSAPENTLPIYLVERTDTESLLIITGPHNLTILGPSNLTTRFYHKKYIHQSAT